MASGPKLYAICQVKDEEDVIGQSLAYATQYCDRIFVVDNCSIDGTWDVVQSVSREHTSVVPLWRTPESYDDVRRWLVYNEFRSELSDHDWWLVLDADEFLAEDPRPIIHEAARENADLICAWQIHFYFTDVDYESWLRGKDDRAEPVYRRRRYYEINWQETRLYRNRRDRPWDPSKNKSFPDGFRKACKRRILNRHYQFRDPPQIEKRLAVRFGNPEFPHVKSMDWRSVVVPSRGLTYYRDGDPWQFTAAGLRKYYGIVAKNLCRAAVHRLHGIVFGS
jgi:glycosyltransferase involved in cell wall biosynthesis